MAEPAAAGRAWRVLSVPSGGDRPDRTVGLSAVPGRSGRRAVFSMNAARPVSVVIPVLGDEQALAARLPDLLREGEPVEVLVVNGADEETPDMARLREAFPSVRWMQSGAGRSRQMNAGAAAAHGDWLLFLHADTRLEAGWLDALGGLDGARGGAVVWGAFRFALASNDWRARLIEWGVARRVHWLRLPFGNQALFVRRRVFERLGGYADLPLMEDVELVRRLGRHSRPCWLPFRATTSARRWIRDGWLRRSARNVALQLLFFAGVAPERLARWYAPERGRMHATGGAAAEPGSPPRDESL